MRFLAGQHRHARRGPQATHGHVPAGAGEDGLPGGGETGRVRHLPAGDESDAGACGQAEQLRQPFEHRLFRHRRRRGEHEEARVLVPRARQPVSADRRGQAAADDETEEPRSCRRDDAGVGSARELRDDLRRRFAVFG